MNVAGLVATMVMAGQGPAPASREAEIWNFAQVRIEQQIDIWFDSGDFLKAIQVLKIEREMRPYDYEVVTNLGWMLENVEDNPAAKEVYLRYINENPSDSDAALPLAQHFFLKKDYAPVPALLEPAILRTPPPHPNVFRILANTYERTKKYTDSRRVWQAYLKVDPSDLAAVRNLKRVEGKLVAK